jgi:hypothetical protein
VSLSDIRSTHWDHISSSYGLRVHSLELRNAASTPPEPMGMFSWSDEPEGNQSDRCSGSVPFHEFPGVRLTLGMIVARMFVRYMPYLKALFPVSSRTSGPLTWLEGGNKRKGLLSIVDHSGRLYYQKINGNVDAAIVTRASVEVQLPRTGLCILFELKKAVESSAIFQAMGQLLLANVHSPDWRPVVIVTDLREYWSLLWMDGLEIKVGRFESPGAAFVVVDSLIAAAADAQATPQGAAASGAVASSRASPQAVPDYLAARTPLPSSPPAIADTSLADLVDLLPDNELKAAQATLWVQQLLRLPTFSCGPDSQL